MIRVFNIILLSFKIGTRVSPGLVMYARILESSKHGAPVTRNFHPRPRGPTPKHSIWDKYKGCWVEDPDNPPPEKRRVGRPSKRPRPSREEVEEEDDPRRLRARPEAAVLVAVGVGFDVQGPLLARQAHRAHRGPPTAGTSQRSAASSSVPTRRPTKAGSFTPRRPPRLEYIHRLLIDDYGLTLAWLIIEKTEAGDDDEETYARHYTRRAGSARREPRPTFGRPPAAGLRPAPGHRPSAGPGRRPEIINKY